jgi:hypothetical protein
VLTTSIPTSTPEPAMTSTPTVMFTVISDK